MRFFALCLVLALSTATAAAQSADPNLKFTPSGDPAMARAVADARATLPAFLETSRHPQAGQEAFSVKVGLGPTGHDEFFWLAPFEVKGDKVSGRLANEPEVVNGYRKGQTVEKPLGEVTDWMYFDHGKMRGNFSACVLLAREGPAALADFERTYGMPCRR